MLEKIKTALRITHTYLDRDILDTISTARAEMIRSGINNDKANDGNDALIAQAIKTYCLYVYAPNSKDAEGYFESWQYQLDNIRKTSAYAEGSED